MRRFASVSSFLRERVSSFLRERERNQSPQHTTSAGVDESGLFDFGWRLPVDNTVDSNVGLAQTSMLMIEHGSTTPSKVTGNSIRWREQTTNILVLGDGSATYTGCRNAGIRTAGMLAVNGNSQSPCSGLLRATFSSTVPESLRWAGSAFLPTVVHHNT